MNDAKSRSVELLPDRVIKRFRFPEEFFRELAVYRLNLDITPRLLEHREPEWIAVQRADGVPYLNHPEGFDPIRLAECVAILHQAVTDDELRLCHIDNQPANILWDGRRYQIIDFADSRLDRPETDISHLLLFWAEEYEPERFARLAAAFIQAYRETGKLSGALWRNSLRLSRERFYSRRALYGKSAPRLGERQRQDNQSVLERLV